MCSAKWSPPPHAGIKEQIVQGYLRIWFTRLSSKVPSLLYIDGFAGPGIYENGVKGSPLIAMDEAAWALQRHEDSKVFLVFIEKDPQVFEELRINVARHLEELEKDYGDTVIKRLNIGFGNTDFSEVIEELEKQNENLKYVPTFVFIDPFGLAKCGFSFDWLQTVAKLGKVEVLLNFYVHGIERNRSQISAQRIMQIFGEYIDISAMSVEEMVGFLQSKVKNELGMYVLLYEMRNRKNRTLYYLVFATKHPEGVKKMKEVMRNASGNDFFFTNEKRSDQLRLFMPGINEFEKDFLETFRDRSITVNEIFNYYAASDDYIWTEKDIRKFLKELERKGKIKAYKRGDKKRRKGSFPPDVIIEIL